MPEKHKRWLVWTGAYTHVGACNGHFTRDLPDDGEELRMRLRVLGFRTGKIGDVSLEAAIPSINGLLAPTYPDAAPRKGAVLGQPADDLRDEARSRIAAWSWSAVGRDRAVFAPPTVAAPLALVVNPSDARAPTRTTLNLDSSYGAVVVGTPKAFHAPSQLACIEVEFGGFERIRSALLRIYRNIEPESRGEPPLVRCVYQEVLDRVALEHLPASLPHRHHVLPQAPEVQYLLAHNAGFAVGSADGSSGPIGGTNTFWHAAHAPFFVALWVSDRDDRFAGQRDAAEDAMLHEERPPFPPGYLNRVPPPDPARPPERYDPAIELMETLGLSDSERAALALNLRDVGSVRLAKDWRELENRHRGPSNIHTEIHGKERKLGQSLLGKPCKLHDRVFMDRCRINLEGFAREFQRQPLKIYRTLRVRADAAHADENGVAPADAVGFHYPELAETFANIERHIARWEQRLCCGEAADAVASLKRDAAETFARMRADIAAERAAVPLRRAAANAAWADVSAGFRYKPSIRLIARCIRVFTQLVGATRNTKELAYFAQYQPTGANADAKIAMAWSATLGHVVAPDAHTFTCRGATSVAQAYDDDGRDLHDALLGTTRGAQGDLPARAHHIVLLPSYNPLNTTFFSRVRQVPMFMLGLIDMSYLLADGIFQAPYGFFVHDNFHVNGFAGSTARQQWTTIHDWLDEHGLWDRELLTYTRWNANAALLDARIQAIADAELRDAIDTLLFSVLHEPLNSSEIPQVEKSELSPDKLQTILAPALLERSTIETRLSSNGFMADQAEKMRNLYFGYVFPDGIVNRQDEAKEAILQMITDFEATAR